MSESVTIKFRYSAEEYSKAVRLHHAARTNLPLDVSVLALGLAIGCWLVSDKTSAWFGGVLLTVMALWILMMLYVFFVAPKVAFRYDPKLKEEYELTFTSEGVQFRTASIDSKLQWSLYSRALVDRDFFLLYYGKHYFSTIPKRVFSDSAALQTFESLLIRFVPTIKRRA